MKFAIDTIFLGFRRVRDRKIVVTITLVCCMIGAVRGSSNAADLSKTNAPDLQGFNKASQITVGDGTYKLMGWRDRDTLTLKELGDVTQDTAPSQFYSMRWATKNGIAADLLVMPGGLMFRTLGRTDFTASFQWAPALVFEPSKAGKY